MRQSLEPVPVKTLGGPRKITTRSCTARVIRDGAPDGIGILKNEYGIPISYELHRRGL